MSYNCIIYQLIGTVNHIATIKWDKVKNMLDKSFGIRFTEILENSKITNTEITRLAEISKNNIGNYKNGQIPNATILYKLSQIFGVSMEYLLTGKEPEELTLEEKKLVNLYRSADERGKRAIFRTAEAENLEQESSDSMIG